MDMKTLEARMYSAFPLLKIETDEEPRVLSQLRRVAQRLGKPMITWSIASGFETVEVGPFTLDSPKPWPASELAQPLDDENPEEALEKLTRDTKNTIVVLLDFHPYFEKARIVRLLKELAFDSEDLSNLIDQEAALFKVKRKDHTLKIDETAKSLLVSNLVGVNASDAQRLIRNAIYIDNAITDSDVPEVKKAKYELISKSGALTYEYDTSSFAHIGGFQQLKHWIKIRQHAILASDENGSDVTDRPKGILLLGVQGCGKSLAARALAGQLGIPLIRLDFGSLFNKYVGESEKNVREALRSAEVMSPCVLWVDELEKSISSGEDSTGSSSRVLSYLLNWMQENNAGTFVVATANDVTSLPPELIRKGRLDEIFFVDLPNRSVRIEITRSVLLRRDLDTEAFDLNRIADACIGFSGAEIEQAVVSSLFHAGYTGAPLCTDSILHEIRQTQPLSVVRAESIAELRHWASERTVPVDTPDDPTTTSTEGDDHHRAA